MSASQARCSRTFAFALATCLTATACDACDETVAPVPFKLDAGRTSRQSLSDTGRGAPERVIDAGFAAEIGLLYDPPSTLDVAIEGANFKSAAPLVALLPIDVDRDGDRDALFATISASGSRSEIEVSIARRDATVFSNPQRLFRVQSQDPLRVLRALAMHQVSPQYAVFSAIEVDPRAESGEPTDALTFTTLIELGSAPHVALELAAAPALQLSPRIERKDEDEFPDWVITASAPNDFEATPVHFVWLNRAGGLARDRMEPEITIQSLAEKAARAVDRPASSLQFAEEARHIFERLCAESGRAELRVGATWGLPCGPSVLNALSHAEAYEIVALTKLNRAADAWGRHVRAASRMASWTRAEKRLVQAALTRTYFPETRYRVIEAPFANLAAAFEFAFLDEQTVAASTNDGVWSWVLGTASPVPSSASTSREICGPSGSCVKDVRRNCAGIIAMIGPRNSLGSPGGGTEVLLESTRGASPRCNRASSAPAGAKDGGWDAIGWAGTEVFFANPLEVRSSVLGAPIHTVQSRPLAESPLPFVLLLKDAIFWRTSAGEVRILKVPGDPSLPAPGTVALSPTANRIAVARGSKIFIIGENLPATPAIVPPAPTTLPGAPMEPLTTQPPPIPVPAPTQPPPSPPGSGL